MLKVCFTSHKTSEMRSWHSTSTSFDTIENYFYRKLYIYLRTKLTPSKLTQNLPKKSRGYIIFDVKSIKMGVKLWNRKICNIGSLSGSNYMQWYPGPKVEYSKANQSHKQSWLYKNQPIFVQNGSKNAKNQQKWGSNSWNQSWNIYKNLLTFYCLSVRKNHVHMKFKKE